LTAAELSATCRLGREPVHVGRAREQTRKALCEWGLGEHTDLAELIVSELVTNALCHGDGPVEMRLATPAAICGSKSTTAGRGGRSASTRLPRTNVDGAWNCSMG
jgi:hypothetical protein